MAMKCALVIPVRSFADSKSRLSISLNDEAREALVRETTIQVIEAGRSCRDIEKIVLVSNDDQVNDFSIRESIDFYRSDKDLNTAIYNCTEELRSVVPAVIVTHSDLGMIKDFDLVCSQLDLCPNLISPDRHRTGTNLFAHSFEYQNSYFFGDDSLHKHMVYLTRNRREFRLIQTPQYSFDIDVPIDLEIFNRYLNSK